MQRDKRLGPISVRLTQSGDQVRSCQVNTALRRGFCFSAGFGFFVRQRSICRRNSMRSFLSLLILFLLPATAHAHLGHLGEVAGHSHVIALGAGLVAAALAAWIGKEKLKAEAEKDNEDEQGEPEGETEAAGA
jgi:hypothetical protein